MSLWVDKYKPKKISDIVGNKVQIKKAKLWLSNYRNKVKGTKLSLFICGPPGIGKTTLSHLIFKSFDYDIIEFNASDIRNQKLVREHLKSIIGKVSISKLMGGNLLNGIIMDEVDGLSSGDKGGISELITFINPNKNKRGKNKIEFQYNNPIICISNTDSDKKMRDLKKECEIIHFVYPKKNELYDFAIKILEKENKEIDDDELLKIIMFCQNDIRKLISTLEYYFKKDLGLNKNDNDIPIDTNNYSNVNDSNVNIFLENLDQKKQDVTLFGSVYNILNEYKNIDDIINLYLSDKNLINLLIHENILGMMKNYKNNDEEKIKIMEKIYENMAISDIYDNEIYMNNNFDLAMVNGVVKCANVSYLLNQQKKLTYQKFSSSDIVFSKLLSKFSLHYTNHKNRIYIFNKLKLYNSIDDNFVILFSIIKSFIYFYNNKGEINKNYFDIKYYVNNYNLEADDFEKMYKLIKQKIKNTKYEDVLSKLTSQQLDKKFFQKGLKYI